MFHKINQTVVGQACTGSETLNLDDFDHVKVVIKNRPDDWNRYYHASAPRPKAYKQDLPSHTTVTIYADHGDRHHNEREYIPPAPRREESREAYLFTQVPDQGYAPPVDRSERVAPRIVSSQGVVPQDDAIGRTAMELNKVRDVTELNFKPDGNGNYKANVQGVFKNGFAKAFKEDPAFAQKLLGSDAVTLSEDRESIVLKRPMSADEIQTFQDNAAAIGKLKRGDLRRAHEIYDLESHNPSQGSGQTRGSGSPAHNGQSNGSAAIGQDDASAVRSAADAQRSADAAQENAKRAEAARQRAEAAAAALRSPASDTKSNSAHLSPEDRVAIAQVILAKLGYDLGPKGNDGRMGHHNAEGGFTGHAIEAFKKDVGFAPPLNADLTDHTFDRLIQRYQGMEGKDPSGLLDAKTVQHLQADQTALKDKGVKVSHAIPDSAAVQTEISRNRGVSDLSALQTQYEQLSKQLGAKLLNASNDQEQNIIPPSQTPVLKTAQYVPAR